MLAAALMGAACVSSEAHAQSRPELLRMVGQTLSGTIVSVADGDTVRARLDATGRTLTIRIEGVDAPEQGEPFSTQARNATRVMLFNKKVQLTATDVDRYDRLVARVALDGRDSSLALIEAGLACHFTRFVNDPVLAKAQSAARAAGRGFWAANSAKPACVKFTGASPQRR